MMGKFPENPTRKELRTLLGFRMVPALGLSILAAWRALEGDFISAIAIVLILSIISAIYVVPRFVQLRNLKGGKEQE